MKKYLFEITGKTTDEVGFSAYVFIDTLENRQFLPSIELCFHGGDTAIFTCPETFDTHDEALFNAKDHSQLIVNTMSALTMADALIRLYQGLQ
jgi:hypothetical protein